MNRLHRMLNPSFGSNPPNSIEPELELIRRSNMPQTSQIPAVQNRLSSHVGDSVSDPHPFSLDIGRPEPPRTATEAAARWCRASPGASNYLDRPPPPPERSRQRIGLPGPPSR